MSKTVHVWGYDPNGVPRVYAQGPQLDVAITRCKEAIRAYVARRRDTGPVDQWTIFEPQHGPLTDG